MCYIDFSVLDFLKLTVSFRLELRSSFIWGKPFSIIVNLQLQCASGSPRERVRADRQALPQSI